MKPAMNNQSVILAKELLVDMKDLKNTDNNRTNKNREDTNHSKEKAPTKRLRQKKTESWYCAVEMQKRYEALCNL